MPMLTTRRNKKDAHYISDVPSHALIDAFENLRSGTLDCIFPNEVRKKFEGTQPGTDARFELYDLRVLDRILADGDIGLGEDYVAGLWDSDDLSALLYVLLENSDAFVSFLNSQQFHKRVTQYAKAKVRANTLVGSSKNIQEHYDLGNDFYQLWLDDTFTYSSALFNGDEGKSLEQAQRDKYRRILDQLAVAEGEDILEIGCGWGGFAEAAVERGLRVTGVTISEQQYDYAKARLAQNPAGEAAQIIFQDYRKVDGQYGHIVSIGMFEHVGEEYWPTYMEKIAACLKAAGKAMIQTIAVSDDRFSHYRKGSDFVREYIFPGGMLPSEKRFREVAEQAGLNVVEVFHFGPDYAITLRKWRQRFEQALGAVRRLGYSESFIRKWRFYLSGCEASFRVGGVSVMQVELAKK